jgi:peptidoglycan/xylan/chitin deacetylase (PgdA/CDA1 family)
MRLIRRFAVAFVAISLSSVLFAQKLTVAITIDDLPFVAPDRSTATLAVTDALALTANQKLLAALSRHHVPVTGFVIQKSSEELGSGVGTKILQEWVDDGLDLGNHSYSHPNFDDLSIAEMEADITRGESLYAPLMKAAHRKPEFFRFPYNHTGDTKEKHDVLAAFLAKHGYTLAPCTIENVDWVFSAAYHIMVSRHDDVAAAKLRADYLAFTAAQIDYFAALHR